MPTIRNIFRRQDENARPLVTTEDVQKPIEGVQPVDIRQQKEPVEYKLSEINDSGVFIPPSPVEKKNFWSTNSSRSNTSSNHRSLINEHEQFNISRESFESYRRSFDISARSPIIQPSEFSRPRASLDSSLRTPPRSSASYTRPVPSTKEEDMEDVNLEEPKPQQPQHRKKGLFSRLTDSHEPSSDQRPPSSGSWHHFSGRKRGQSGQGAELGSMLNKEEIIRDQTPKPERQIERTSEQPTANTRTPEIMVEDRSRQQVTVQ
ncbi:hypothetical protein K431DRAFT_221350 [Polychaeton citri CBS 116435]|uniref:Uncharacterized protein n=1 Tax=Polychaeton citri CBS 116435 TaxID=1314669 RepID=A0A9P4Q919_9PEZI|nr:hypothetical protein K431DRAFT_221350 [Polychaeton citri CBS 116435]